MQLSELTHNNATEAGIVASIEVLPKNGGKATRAGIQEYTEAVRWRYLKATKKEKGCILDEFIRVSGYHRKTAIRLLHQGDVAAKRKRRGRQRWSRGSGCVASDMGGE